MRTRYEDALSVAPWDDVLRQLGPFDYDALRQSDVRWLDSRQLLDADTSDATWRRLGEALDVLALIARVNVHAWQQEVARLWPAYATTWSCSAEEPFEIGILLSVPYSAAGARILKPLKDLVLGVERPHGYYCKARTNIEARFSGPGRLLTPARPRIPVRLQIEFEQGDVHIVAETLHIVAAQFGARASAAKSAQDRRTLKEQARFEIMEFKLDEQVEIDLLDLRRLVKMVEFGVFLHNLPYFSTHLNLASPTKERHNVRSVIQDLQALVVGVGIEGFRGVDELTISSESRVDHLLPLLSAAQVTKALRTVRVLTIPVNWVSEKLVDLWRGVAYSLFSCHAQHRITRLELELDNLRAEYVDAIEDVLLARPSVSPQRLGASVFENLLGRESKSLRCSRVFLSCPADKSKKVLYDLPTPMDLRVIHEDTNSEHAVHAALLPGWGKAWARGQISTTTLGAAMAVTKTNTQENASFREIKITALSEASLPAVTRLMGIIGSKVEDLEIDESCHPTILDHWFAGVLAQFPRLCRLAISHVLRINNLETLTYALASANRRLECLVIDCNVVVSDVNQLHSFFNALGNSHHCLAALGELRLKLSVSGDITLGLLALCDALKVNRRLHTIRLSFDPESRHLDRDTVMELLSPAMQTKPTCRLAPLGLQQKLAFLTVVEGCRTDTSPRSALHQLDSAVLSKVFEFAGQGRARDFQVSI
jgi:hypothetical protein